jgi:type IV secretory pathway protease TraF
MSSSSARGRLDSDRPDQYALFSGHDSSARPLPVWQECRVIPGGEFFFMNWQSADPLDGRYVGSIPSSAVIAREQPVWIERSDHGPHPCSGRRALA